MTAIADNIFRVAILCACAGLAACSTGNANDVAYNNDDPCKRDPSYCVYPVFEGSIHFDGQWHEGRYRYRFHGRSTTEREYWFANAWHAADDSRDASNGAAKKDN